MFFFCWLAVLVVSGGFSSSVMNPHKWKPCFCGSVPHALLRASHFLWMNYFIFVSGMNFTSVKTTKADTQCMSMIYIRITSKLFFFESLWKNVRKYTILFECFLVFGESLLRFDLSFWTGHLGLGDFGPPISAPIPHTSRDSVLSIGSGIRGYCWCFRNPKNPTTWNVSQTPRK